MVSMERVRALIRHFRWQQWLLLLALAGALAFAGFHLVGAAREAAALRSHRNDTIAPWMTVGHVARVYHVDPERLEQALNLSAAERERRPLRFVAHERGQTFEELQAQIRGVIGELTAPGRATPSASPGPRSVVPTGAAR
jgi:hypothetical protein